MADPYLAGHGIEIEKLPDSAGEQGDEPVEGGRAADIGEKPDVPFHIRVQVVSVVCGRLHGGSRQLGHRAAQDERVGVGLRLVRTLREFAESEGKKLEECTSPCKRLRHSLLEHGLMRAGEDVLARNGSSLVHHRLYRRSEIRHALDLVDDQRRLVHGEEAAIVVLRHVPRLGIFEIDVAVGGEARLCERGLAGLARSDNREHREFPGALLGDLRHFAWNHFASLCVHRRIIPQSSCRLQLEPANCKAEIGKQKEETR